MKFKKENYPENLFILFVIIFVLLGISPWHRDIWIVESSLTVFFVALLVLTYKKFRFSNLSYTLLFVFLVLHTIGSHYSYTEVPLFDLIREWFDLGRNHYDRVVHFLFGILFFIPGYELVSRKLKLKGFWGYLSVFLLLSAANGIYEVIEFLFIVVVGEARTIGISYLGMQGDQWDTQKDMFLGMLGYGIMWFGMRLKNLRNKKGII